MKNLLILFILAGSLLPSCSKKDDVNPEDNSPQEPKIVLNKAANNTDDWRISIDAAEAGRADIWIDLNNNGTKDEGEAVTKFNVLVYYPLVSKTVTIYGKITVLNCADIRLVALDVTKNTALKELYCFGNNLTALDLSKNTALEVLYCDENELTALDVNNTALKKLHCNNNQLTTLDVSKNIALIDLVCFFNQLATLDVSKNIALTVLDCSNNQLTTLTLSPNLTDLAEVHVARNKLSADAMSNLLRAVPNRTGKEKGFVQARVGLAETNGMPSIGSQAVAVGRNWEVRVN